MLGNKNTKQTVFRFFDENRNIAVEYLRKAGCKCPNPDVAFRTNVGPRCRSCSIIAEVYSEVKEKYDLK